MKPNNTALDDDWQHRLYALGKIGDVPTEWLDLVRLWDGKRAGRRLPAWSSFDMLDFKPWLGYVAVYKVTQDPLNTLTTLWGTQLAVLYGEDRTGNTMRDSHGHWSMTERDWRFMERVVKEPCIGNSEGTLYWQDREHIRVNRLFLPYGEDGETCDTLSSATRRIAS